MHQTTCILDGFACRYKLTSEGKRHIMAYLISGDFCDLHVFILKAMDHNIGALSPCRVVNIPRNRILEMTTRPALARALWWATLVDEAVLREWLVNMGQREAPERIAHLLCELLLRLRAIGLAASDAYELPITQEALGDTMGLSAVHVNRSLQKLRSENSDHPEAQLPYDPLTPSGCKSSPASIPTTCICNRRSKQIRNRLRRIRTLAG